MCVRIERTIWEYARPVALRQSRYCEALKRTGEQEACAASRRCRCQQETLLTCQDVSVLVVVVQRQPILPLQNSLRYRCRADNDSSGLPTTSFLLHGSDQLLLVDVVLLVARRALYLSTR